MNYSPQLIKTLTYDKPGTYEFQPKDYPGLVYVRATMRPASEGVDGRVVLELWGWHDKGGAPCSTSSSTPTTPGTSPG